MILNVKKIPYYNNEKNIYYLIHHFIKQRLYGWLVL